MCGDVIKQVVLTWAVGSGGAACGSGATHRTPTPTAHPHLTPPLLCTSESSVPRSLTPCPRPSPPPLPLFLLWPRSVAWTCGNRVRKLFTLGFEVLQVRPGNWDRDWDWDWDWEWDRDRDWDWDWDWELCAMWCGCERGAHSCC